MPNVRAHPCWRSAILGPRTLAAIAALVEAETGIVVNDEKASLVQARLTRRLRATRISDFDAYLEFVRSNEGAAEFKQMLRSLTTNVTKFNREPHHFSDLRDNVLPVLADKVRSGQRLRIWSSACSTGEEPYSIAMELCTFFPDIENLDIKILATDIDSDVVNTARSGHYPVKSIEQLSPAQRNFFPDFSNTTDLETYQISRNARKIISFNTLNLIEEWPFSGPFDVIFCRNVMIYFQQGTQEKILQRFGGVSRPGSRLYIGHSERLVGPAQKLFKSVGTTSFARIG